MSVLTENMEHMTYGQMSHVIHQWALDKGWWDDVDRNVGEIIMLFVTEVSETFEEWRDGRSMRLPYWYLSDGRGGITYAPETASGAVKPKPEGVPIEIADIFIRILDVCPMWEIDIDNALDLECEKPFRWPGGTEAPPVNVGHACMSLTAKFSELFTLWTEGYSLNQIRWVSPEDGRAITSMTPGAIPQGFPLTLARILLMLLQLCGQWQIDIKKYIAMKHEYNVTRAYRHGGKLA